MTLWNKEPDDVSLQESDRLLFEFQDACDATGHLRKGVKGNELGWALQKMFQLALFKPATIRNGHAE